MVTGKMDNKHVKLAIDVKERKVSLQFLADCLIHAVEAGMDGIGYWCEIVSYKWTEGPEHTQAIIIESEDDDAEELIITTETIRVGIERAIAATIERTNENRVRDDYWNAILESTVEDDATMIDSCCADIIVQYGLFGETVYG